MAANPEPRIISALGPGGWMLVCLLLPTLVYIWAVREPAPRWLATYFANAGLEGVGMVREELDVDHDWEGRPPVEGTAGGEFSARWDSCLDLREGQSVAFQLTSNDGTRLLIDGTLVIDNWGSHPRRTRGIDVTLQAGVHHLRVEYEGTADSASVTLVASFDEDRPRRIAPERLRSPNKDPHQPCEPL